MELIDKNKVLDEIQRMVLSISKADVNGELASIYGGQQYVLMKIFRFVDDLGTKIWHGENDVPKYNQNGITDFIVSSIYGHIYGEAHTYTPERWSVHLEVNQNKEFRWAYESDLIDFNKVKKSK